MIVVQDKIVAPGAELGRLQRMLRERYMSGAAQRGLEFVESLISPPVKLEDQPSTLWLRWQVPDAEAWWAMRARSGDPAVVAFWAEVDTFCLSRERRYLGADDAAALPEPEDIGPFIVGIRGHRETAQLALRHDVTDAGRAELVAALESAAGEMPGVEAADLGENLAPEYAVGHYTWDLLFPDRETADTARNSDAWRKRIEPVLRRYCRSCHALDLETLGAGLRRPGLTNGIKRTGYFRLLPDTKIGAAKRFERDLLEMPAHIPAILNWRLSRARPLPWDSSDVEPWTYVWEQEFDSIDALTGPYMLHPNHWAHIDRWFDPESGSQAVDVGLSHAFSPFRESLLTSEAIR